MSDPKNDSGVARLKTKGIRAKKRGNKNRWCPSGPIL